MQARKHNYSASELCGGRFESVSRGARARTDHETKPNETNNCENSGDADTELDVLVVGALIIFLFVTIGKDCFLTLAISFLGVAKSVP